MKTSFRLTARPLALFAALIVFAAPDTIRALNPKGTNAPGAGTSFSITLPSGTTNLSLVISNTSTLYSYLYLKAGGAAATNNYDHVSRLKGATNRINLATPEFSGLDYGLLVFTPSSSLTHPFTVLVSSNRSDLRSANYPQLKSHVFSTTGILDYTGADQWHYYQVDVPTNLPGWRIVLSQTGLGDANLYVRKGAIPTTSSYDKRSINNAIDTLTYTNAEATNMTYFIGVLLPSSSVGGASYTLSTELAGLNTLTWDPGAEHSGTQVFTNTSALGGDYFLRIRSQSTTVGAWRTALYVDSGEADVAIKSGSFSADASTYTLRTSSRAGADGFVLHSSDYTVSQDYHIVVHAAPGAQWRLFSGEAYVMNLGAVAAYDSGASSTNVTMGAEGWRFFKTTPGSGALAWRIGLNGATNDIFIRTSVVPMSGASSRYNHRQPGKMLVVPSYLVGGTQYFIGVSDVPGAALNLDSREQQIIDAPFLSAQSLNVNSGGYVTYRIQVPVDQIAWQIAFTPSSGDASVCVRRNQVPNEWNNEGFSEVAGSATDSLSLVPNKDQTLGTGGALTDGAFFVTVYGTPYFAGTLVSTNPVITDTAYVSTNTNDDPNRVGWRYYRVPDIASQLGSLGWYLFLQNQPAATDLAIRRNAVPGRWNYRRNASYDTPTVSVQSYVSLSGSNGFIQEPGHQADIWYVGVYNPSNTLGGFVLNLRDMTAPVVSFDGAGTNVAGVESDRYAWFRVDVPAGALGWDVRLADVTSGNPRLVVRRDQLPDSMASHSSCLSCTWSPGRDTAWISGYQWAAGNDWTDYIQDSDGNPATGRILAMGMGNPLEAGTYYIGVCGTNTSGSNSFTLQSRGIGAGLSIPVHDIAFNGGSTNITGLAVREAAYFRV